jgi:PAS domain S-box-containing protein
MTVASPEHTAELGLGVLFDRLLDAVVVARLSTGRIVEWNRAAEQLFGWTAQEALDQSIEMLMPGPLASLHRAGCERYLRTGHGLIVDATAPVEMPAQHKDGRALRIELSLSEMLDAYGDRFAVAIMRDAMHRKQLELTNLALVQERLARSDTEAEVDARDELLDAVVTTLQGDTTPDDLRSLAAALAEFRRLHGGQVVVRPEQGDLVDVLRTAADAVRHRAGSRHVFVHAPPSAPATFDVATTRQILDQVLDEALRRSAGGSIVEIRLEQSTARTAQLAVRVQGTGAQHEPGVGVHLSRTLMQRQGGTLTTGLTAGGGLEVVLTFPGCPHPARRKPRPRPVSHTAAGR